MGSSPRHAEIAWLRNTHHIWQVEGPLVKTVVRHKPVSHYAPTTQLVHSGQARVRQLRSFSTQRFECAVLSRLRKLMWGGTETTQKCASTAQPGVLEQRWPSVVLTSSRVQCLKHCTAKVTAGWAEGERLGGHSVIVSSCQTGPTPNGRSKTSCAIDAR